MNWHSGSRGTELLPKWSTVRAVMKYHSGGMRLLGG
jgi:hypothetical protein